MSEELKTIVIQDLSEYSAILVPKNKKVSSIEFEDGSAEIFLDLPQKQLSAIYRYAAELDISFDEAVIKMIRSGLDILEQQSKEQ